MARKISNIFVIEFIEGSLNPLLRYVQMDDTLNMELRGDRVCIYYRGGALMSVSEKYIFSGLSDKYLNGNTIIAPRIDNIEEYIPRAKHVIDLYVREVKNHLGEKDIQQQIARENNYSANSLDTDYFVIDTEYQDLGRFDIVAMRWDSTSSARKLPKSCLPTITIFEVKQGYDSISGKSGMCKHIEDFNKFISNADNIEAFKKDMIAVFKQKCRLGLIADMGKYNKIIDEKMRAVAPNIEFVFLLANYKFKSTQLRTALGKIEGDCKFIYASPMGYGLYSQNIVDKASFMRMFNIEL